MVAEARRRRTPLDLPDARGPPGGHRMQQKKVAGETSYINVAHSHPDQNHFMIWAHGKLLAVDGGGAGDGGVVGGDGKVAGDVGGADAAGDGGAGGGKRGDDGCSCAPEGGEGAVALLPGLVLVLVLLAGRFRRSALVRPNKR